MTAAVVLHCRDQADDPQDRLVSAETKQYGDIIRLDSTDTYADLARKTLKLFSKLPDKFDASFYFKVGLWNSVCTSALLWCARIVCTAMMCETLSALLDVSDHHLRPGSHGRTVRWSAFGTPDICFTLQVDDDVIVDTKALAAYLRERRTRGNLYMVRLLLMHGHEHLQHG